MPEKTWYSIEELLTRHRDEADDFIVGELLHSLRENDVPISLIYHAPVAMTSAKYRVDADGKVTVNEDHEFKGAHVTTVPKHGELGALTASYPKVPGEKTPLPYYVDVALKDAGYDVVSTLNPSAVKVVWDHEHNLLTGNGPQSTEAQAERLAEVMRERSNTAAGTHA